MFHVRGRRLGRLAGLAAAVSLTVVGPTVPSAGAASSPTPVFNPPKSYYLSLGDSLGFGFQLQKFFDLVDAGAYTPDAFNHGYTDDFAALMRQVSPNLKVVNYSCPAESTTSMIEGPCGYQEFFALHDAYAGSQLDAALAFLRSHSGQVSPITISMSTNDIDPLFTDTCNFDLTCVAAGTKATTDALRTNLTRILTALRRAAPNAEIITIAPWTDFYRGAAVDAAYAKFLPAVYDAAAAARAYVVDGYSLITSSGQQCALTFLCTDLEDAHPTDVGYARLADAFWTVSGYARLQN